MVLGRTERLNCRVGHGAGILRRAQGHPLHLAQCPDLGQSLCQTLPGGHQPVQHLESILPPSRGTELPTGVGYGWLIRQAHGASSPPAAVAAWLCFFLTRVFRGWPLLSSRGLLSGVLQTRRAEERDKGIYFPAFTVVSISFGTVRLFCHAPSLQISISENILTLFS